MRPSSNLSAHACAVPVVYSTLLAGAHPQRLGSHLGSRLDFTTGNGSCERLTVRGLSSASAASTVWEGPLGSGKRAGWLVAVRKGYFEGGLEQRFESAWRAAGTVYHRNDRDGLRFRNAEVRVVNNRVLLPTGPYLVNVLTGDTRGVYVSARRRRGPQGPTGAPSACVQFGTAGRQSPEVPS